jgi:hypothetical protein
MPPLCHFLADVDVASTPRVKFASHSVVVFLGLDLRLGNALFALALGYALAEGIGAEERRLQLPVASYTLLQVLAAARTVNATISVSEPIATGLAIHSNVLVYSAIPDAAANDFLAPRALQQTGWDSLRHAPTLWTVRHTLFP